VPNLKISQLSNGSLGQAADEFVVARAGANYKITGANVAASATSVGTLTSLTVSGNVAVNTNTFFVDTVNNRVGIGIASPTISPLQAEADADANRGLYVRNINTGTAAYGFVAAASLVGALELRAYSAANSVWPNRAVLNSGSGFTNGLAIVANGATPIEMWTNGNRRLTVDSAGNLGLGVTPSAWGAGFTAMQYAGGAVWSGSIFQGMNQNAFYTGTNWIYRTTAAATNYEQTAGIHRWYNAASGTAGNTISFTQAMTLDASSNLTVGGWVRASAASAGAASTTTIGSTTATTVGAAGGASALPATPLGYIIAHVGTTQVKIPYYNA